MPRLLPILPVLCLALLLGCDNPRGNENGIYEGAQTVQLKSENISIKLPLKFKRSSRYLLIRDLPDLAKDSAAMLLIQNTLEFLEFDDAETDVFVDTVTNFGFLVILNVEHIPFDQRVGAMLNQQIQKSYSNLEAKVPSLKAEKVESILKGTDKIKAMKFKHKITFIGNNQPQWRSAFFVTTQSRSYVIYQISAEEEDIEKYLWSIKD